MKCFLLVSLLTCFTFAAEKIETTAGCNYHGKIIPEGVGFVPAPIGYCLKVKCLSAEGNTMGLLTCPSKPSPPGTHLSPKDLTKEFPDCCPKLVPN
ncbi:uncharacterized protein LOC116164470 [Photinus pyralis]|uniref:uncharacterized protein LOC116164470 n=1 Tax=Photinus pyralis TaxID=7054 RepID=UPI0012676124|nr:uncharacterized protein LOC116164470 [Photinus pyralis]